MRTDQSIENHLLELELRLMDPEVRRSAEQLTQLLADDFREFGASGAIYDRRQIIDALRDEPFCSYAMYDFRVISLTEEIALVTYRVIRTTSSTGEVAHSLRSSIWVYRDDRWQMLFHQGTRTEG